MSNYSAFIISFALFTSDTSSEFCNLQIRTYASHIGHRVTFRGARYIAKPSRILRFDFYLEVTVLECEDPHGEVFPFVNSVNLEPGSFGAMR